MVRRFPKEIADRRLGDAVELASVLGKNMAWISDDAFMIVDWSAHYRLRLALNGDGVGLV